MSSESQNRGPIRFGVFEVNLPGRTLRKSGARVRLQEKPFRLLAMLLARPGEVVTREELQRELWPNEEYGEFDLGLNTAVKKLRQALGDSSENPRWIETIPKVGYKFLAPLEKGAARAGEGVEGAHKRTPPVRKWLWLAVAAGFAAIAVATWLSMPEDSGPRPVYRFSVPPPDGAVIRSFELSPDGRHLAFVAEEGSRVRLWVRSFEEVFSRPLPGTEGADPLGTPFWSPDSRYIGFFSEGKLKKIGIAGEPPVTLADAPFGRGGSWNERGQIIFSPFNHRPQPSSHAEDSRPEARIFAVSDKGGDPQAVSEQDTAPSHRSPSFLPGGGRFLYHARLGGSGAEGEIRMGTLGEPESPVVMRSKSHAVYAPISGPARGYLLTVQNEVLVAHPFDAENGSVVGDAIPAMQGVGEDLFKSRGMFSISASGVLAYANSGPSMRERELVWLNRKGEHQQLLRSGGNYYGVRMSPDGSRAAVVAPYAGVGGGMVLSLVDLEDGAAVQPEAPRSAFPFVWSPDSRTLVAGQGVWGLHSEIGIFRIPADGSSGPVNVLPGFGLMTRDWSSDSQWLLLEDISKPSDHDLLIAAVGGKEAKPYLATAYSERSGRFSPNGRFVAYSSNETGVDEIYVRTFPEAGAKRQVSIGGGVSPVWRPDGKELFFVSPESLLMSVPVSFDNDGGFKPGNPEPLFPVEIDTAIGSLTLYDVAVDGQKSLVTRALDTLSPSPVHIVVNWDEELKRWAEQRRSDR